MKSDGLVFFVILIAIVILAGACSKKSEEPNTDNVRQMSSVNSSPVSYSQSTHEQSNVYFEEDQVEEPTEPVEQILQDISAAKVSEKTNDLKQTFGRLDAICTKAMGTCTALLAADYVTDQHKELLTRKEALK